MAKLVLDALNDHAWSDDSNVVYLTARKVQVAKPDARTTVRITRVAA